MKLHPSHFLLFLLVALSVISCRDDDPITEEDTLFAAQLSALYTNVIAPDMAVMVAASEDLRLSAEALELGVDLTAINDLQTKLKTARIAFQHLSHLNFGPAEETDTFLKVNTFPADTSAIANNADAGSNDVSNFDELGLPTLAWMLHHADDATLVDYFSDSDLGDERRNHLLYLATQLDLTLDLHQQAWTSGFATDFRNATGASAGSGMSLYVNGLIQDYEKLKRDKVALPLGLLTLGIPLADRTEAFHGGYSVELALNNLQSVRRAFTGSEGSGIDDLLDELGAWHGATSQNLSTAILEQLDAAELALQAVPDPLSSAIESDPDAVETAYNELQAAVSMLKADMPSALGISITFSDNDGD